MHGSKYVFNKNASFYDEHWARGVNICTRAKKTHFYPIFKGMQIFSRITPELFFRSLTRKRKKKSNK